jgi:predicted acylesterase/phospholipase RssA
MKIIKNIVIPGGAIFGLSYYGALKHLCQNNVFDIQNIKTIHATSVGCIIGTFMALKYDWVELDNYIINRPWQNVFKFSLYSIMNCYNENGLFDVEVIREIFLPLFSAKDISIDITMKDFYDICGIELHFFTVNVSTFKLIDINYKTFPDWSVVESVYASACVPILFKPFFKNGVYYTDGGILANCPINQLFINDDVYNEEEVLCININEADVNNEIKENPHSLTLLKYVFVLVSKLIKVTTLKKETYKNVQEVLVDQKLNPIFDLYSILNNANERIKLIDNGIECAKKYLEFYQ